MADLGDMMMTIAQNLVTPIYPNGTGNPSIINADVRIEQGWPIRSQLDVDLQNGRAHVSVFPMGQPRDVTKFERSYESLTLTPATIFPVVENNTVMITGTISMPQAVMVIANNIGYSYGIQTGDTLATIATALAILIPNATAVENVITIENVYSLLARTANPYTASQEIGRQDQMMMITIWVNNPADRTTLASAIDIYMRENYRIVLNDGYFAQVFYNTTNLIDDLEQSLVYRRDLIYKIQYATTVANDFTSIADPFVNSITVNY